MDKFKHYHIADNPLCFPGEEMIIKMDEPRCYIRYRLEDGYMSSYEDFYNCISEVQWIDGYPPEKEVQEYIFNTAWNFIGLVERVSEGELEDLRSDLLAEGYTEDEINDILN